MLKLNMMMIRLSWIIILAFSTLSSSSSSAAAGSGGGAKDVIRYVTATEGSEAYLHCKIEKFKPGMQVAWVRVTDLHILSVGEHIYTADSRFRIQSSDDKTDWTLEIRNLQLHDAAQYDCQISDKEGRMKYQHIRLKVISADSAILTVEWVPGEGNTRNLILECLTNQPSATPEFLWYRDERLIVSLEGRIQISVKRNLDTNILSSFLTISDVTVADAAKYTCRPKHGEPDTVDLTVIGIPWPPSILHVTGVTFTSVEITWRYVQDALHERYHYILQYRPDHSEEDFTNITHINTNSYNVEGLMPMTEYGFRVLAMAPNGGEQSIPSHYVLVTTAALSFSLLRAVENGHLSVVQDLLELDADIDEGDGMYLKMASQMGHLDVVEFLLAAGADPDADEDGEAVQEASKNGHIEVVKALLEAGADANVGDGMHHAVANTYPEIIKVLHQYGSDVNKPLPERPWKNPETGTNYGFGWSALHVAARWGKTSLVKLLYELGSDLVAKDPNGDTPLHVAVKYPQIWFVRELLKFCPDLSLQNNDGKTVIDLVEDLPHAIYSSLSSEEGVKLRHLVADITVDKIKTHFNTEDAAAALEDEIEFLVESNKTISDLVDAVASTDSHVDIVLQELFEDTVYLEIEDAFADHLCSSEEEDSHGEWRAALNERYEAHCICIPGKGPTIQLKPLDLIQECGNAGV